MIPFLRKVRFQFLKENRFYRYLIYAIGEIFLVVIGILIALQINTWNEEKKIRNYELKMLRELSGVLKKDTGYFNSLVERLRKKGEAVDMLLDLRQNQRTDLDSISKYFQAIRFETLFQYNSGPYGSIKSSGIEKISNDSIRNKMVDLYEFLIPRTEKILEKLKETDSKEEELMESLTERVIIVRNGSSVIQRVITDPKIILKPDFLTFLQVHKSNTYVAQTRLQAVLPAMERLDSLIQVELSYK